MSSRASSPPEPEVGRVPSIRDNERLWNKKYDWSRGGSEWSSLWGGVESQWHWVIFPRIHSFVPALNILEIGAGFGRWSEYLKELSTSLVLVDVSERCIAACRARFADDAHVSCHVNDGRSLAMAEDESIDFAFSFDSLVHVEQDVIEAYVSQLERKLAPEGAAFLHHSNLAGLERGVEHTHWRAPSVSAESVRKFAEDAGFVCVAQELINFGDSHVGRGQELIDCFTVLCRRGSPSARPTRMAENPDFMPQSELITKLAPLYGGFGDHEEEDVRVGPGRLRRFLPRMRRS